MKTSTIIFFSVFFTLYGLINYYIYIRGWQAIPRDTAWRATYFSVFLVASLSLIAGRVLERYSVCSASAVLSWIGSFWFGYILYVLLALLCIDLLRLLNLAFHFLPPAGTDSYQQLKQITALIVFGTATVVLLAGFINAGNPRVRKLEVRIAKPASMLKSLRIAFVSDVHLGNIIRNARLEKMVAMINGMKPDIVLIGGDLVDEDIKPVIENGMGDVLTTLKSRYGTFAITGNHEYIGGVDAACAWMREHGIRVLRDEAVVVDGRFTLVGRDDRSRNFMTEQRRKPVEEILKSVDMRLPVILLDHDPTEQKKNLLPGVDLVLSGHTHHGQLFPLNAITNMIYQVSWGYKLFGSTHTYVSCGFGTWGPPARLGNTPEVVQIDVTLSH